jgi:hypothetical protein
MRREETDVRSRCVTRTQSPCGGWFVGRRVLKSGIELKLFDALAAGPQDVAALSQALGAAPVSPRVVLEALMALGFIAGQSPTAWRKLVPSRASPVQGTLGSPG